MRAVRVAGRWLHARGVVSGLEWSSVWSYDTIGGDSTAKWSWATTERPEWLRAGAKVEVVDAGRRRYLGILAEPEQIDGDWSCSAYGRRTLGQDYQAVTVVDATTDEATTVPDVAIDGALSHGLAWTRPVSIGASPVGTADDTILTVEEIVVRRAKESGKRAVVDQWGQILLASDPTAPTWLLDGMSNYLGTADDQYVSRLYGYYVSRVSATTGQPDQWRLVRVDDTDAAIKLGVYVERTVDLRALGLLTETEARTQIAGRFALTGARMGWTAGFSAPRTRLRTLSGAHANPAAVRAGQMIRLAGVRDFRTTKTNRGMADIVIGEARFVDDEDVCYITPMGYVPRDFSSALAAAQRPEATEAA